MNYLNSTVTQGVAGYFRDLPIPKTFGGFLDLRFTDWLRLTAFAGAVGLAGYVTFEGVRSIIPEDMAQKLHVPRCGRQFWVNPNIEKEKAKVNHVMDIEDISENASYCRCWRAKSFPYCDGSHKQHNEETGDNVGPITVKHRTKEKAAESQ